MTSTLIIEGLRVEVAGKEVLRGFDLLMRTGEVHVIMGPNGSGKSTLAHALTGHPGYKVLGGSVRIDDVELLTMSPSERARHGLLLAMQQPLEVAGVRPLDLFVNVDLSGGERKRAEMVQFGMLRPKFAVLDEIDSGLDVDALGAVARRLSLASNEWECGILVITHFKRLLQELTPTMIHVLSEGRVVATGGPELSEILERDGYEPFRVASA